MLRGRNAPLMPPDRPLNEADIQLIENWILNGAKRWETDGIDAGVEPVQPPKDGGPDAPRDGGVDTTSDVHADTSLTDGGDGGGQ
jgi:hypothetical protein